MDSFTLGKIEFDAVRRILSGYCSCSLGKALAVRISPSRNPDVIRRWLEQVSQMIAAISNAGTPPFAGVTDTSESLTRAKPGAGASGADFAAIRSLLEGAANIKRYLHALPEELGELHALAQLIGDFTPLTQAIARILSPDGLVRDDASPRLSELRGNIAATTREIHDIIYRYLRDPEVRRLLQNATVQLHGDRYVLPVRTENRGRLSGVVHRASASGATVFVEPLASVELNNRLVDLYEDERREVERLLTDLAVHLMPHVPAIADTSRQLAHVDLLCAKAQYACQMEMTCPEVTEQGPLAFNQARHPLLLDMALRDEKQGVPPEQRRSVVPIDVRLGQDFDILIITGSNTGGKTVTLKTTALLAVMVQSGLHIPVQRGATMPVFREILIDIGDEQSLQQSLSTFGAHIHRIRNILQKADRSSLVLLDELGSGTDPDEGGAIGAAVLDELRDRRCLAVVTTHLSILKAYAYNHPRVDNASVEFDTATMSPTYRLRIGTPGESHAIAVAQRLGLGKRVVASAKGHLTDQSRQFKRAIAATSAARQVAEEARKDAQAAHLAALTEQESYEAKLADLHRLQGEFQTWLARLGELKTGDDIFVPSLKRNARLVRLELHRQIALVESNNIQVEVPLPELMPDLGQAAIREEIVALRRQILEQAHASRETQAQMLRTQDEYHRSLQHQKLRARQFDTWLGAIARVKIGDEVPISHKPGKGTVTKVDLPGLKAAVETAEGALNLSLQELFPQTGPFAPHLPAPPGEKGDQRGDQPGRHRRKTSRPASREPHAEPADRHQDRPVEHRRPDSRQAQAIRAAVLKLAPGRQVFVVPFHKRATLIRINADKDLAVVQSGPFEMEIPLADLEPVKES